MKDPSGIRVWVTEIGARGTVVVRWRLPDGENGQETIGKITGKKREDDAVRAAAQVRAAEILQYFQSPEAWEDEPDSAKTWLEARKQYESEYLPLGSKSNANVWRVAARDFEAMMIDLGRPLDDISKIRRGDLEDFRTHVQKRTSEATADTYIATLRAGFAWFAEREWCDPIPAKRRSKRKKSKMRGRPLTPEEVERFCAAVPKVIKTKSLQAGWKHWIEGLYLSGLRIEESLQLTWDNPSLHMVRLGRIPKISFAPTQKNRTVQVVATTPDFAEFLRRTPEADRTGFVFNPCTRAGRIRNEKHASRRVSEIGEKAQIITEPGRTASAHDLRRSFGSRWSLLVFPPVLQHMMRHSSIETTMKYYVDHTADLLGREIKDAYRRDDRPVSADEAAQAIESTRT